MQEINKELTKEKDEAEREGQEAGSRCSTLEAQLRDAQEEKGVLIEQVDTMSTSCLVCIWKTCLLGCLIPCALSLHSAEYTHSCNQHSEQCSHIAA